MRSWMFGCHARGGSLMHGRGVSKSSAARQTMHGEHRIVGRHSFEVYDVRCERSNTTRDTTPLRLPFIFHAFFSLDRLDIDN